MDDDSNNDGFVVRSPPDAGIVVETRPLTPEEMRSLDVGNFFGNTPPATPAQLCAELLAKPRPTLWRSYRDDPGSVLATVGCALFAVMTAHGWLAVLACLPAAVFATTPLQVWRQQVRYWREDRAAAESANAHRRTKGTP